MKPDHQTKHRSESKLLRDSDHKKKNQLQIFFNLIIWE